MRVADAIVKCLKDENVDVVFGYPGGAVLPIYESLRKSDIRHVLVRHEQAAGHCANGYSRSTGKTGVCIATSGPGATNMITGIANAYMDSIPIIAITGQVRSSWIGKDVFQEADIFGATESFTKHSYLVREAKDIPRIIKEAFYIANSGRPGPVLIDIPVDIQNHEIELKHSETLDIRGYKPSVQGNIRQIEKAINTIKNSKNPLICIGGGVIAAKAHGEIRKFIEKSKIPAIHTLMGKGGIEDSSPYYAGFIGSYGMDYANKALANADLLILIGTRAGDRAINNNNRFKEEVKIIHIDIDPAEINKNIDSLIPVVGDAKEILINMIDRIGPLDTENWIKQINLWKSNSSRHCSKLKGVTPKYTLSILSDVIEKDAVLTADVGQNQIWAAHNYIIEGERKFLTSGGLGTMGYSIPAAIGAKIGLPNRRVVAVMGDGGFQMSFSELGTVAQENVDIIFLMFNNNKLGLVSELQMNAYRNTYGIELSSNPDFVKIFEAYGLKGRRVSHNDAFKDALMEALNSNSSFLIECIVDNENIDCRLG